MKGSGLAADEVEGRGGANAGGGEAPTPGAGWRRCVGVDGVKTTGGTGNSFAMAAAIGKEAAAAAAAARVRDLGSCGGSSRGGDSSRSIRPERPSARDSAVFTSAFSFCFSPFLFLFPPHFLVINAVDLTLLRWKGSTCLNIGMQNLFGTLKHSFKIEELNKT